MHNFNVGDWVYAGNIVYGQITEIVEADGESYAYVEFDTGTGGGSLTFTLDDLQLAEPSKETKFIPEPRYAVVVTFSFDSQVSVLLFNTWDDALAFIKKDVEEEYRIDTEENGWDAEYEIFETDGRAVLTTHFKDGDYVVEWKIGTVFERDKED